MQTFAETGDVRHMTQGEYEASTAEVKATYDKWWWAKVTSVDLDQWAEDERVDAAIYERDGETIH